jgi:hypothetical protein
LQQCIYNTFEKKDCLINTGGDDTLDEAKICFIIVNAYHGKRQSAILKLTLIMVPKLFFVDDFA